MHRVVLALTSAAALGFAATGCASTSHAAPQFAPAPANSTRAFSPFVRANGFLFLAGQLGTDSTGKLAPGGIKAETRQ